MEKSEKSLNGIGGWLILIIILFASSALMITATMLSEFLPMFSNGIWENLTSPGGGLYHPLNKALLFFEMGGNTLFALGAVIVLILLFSKSRHTPKAANIWLIGLVLFLAIDLLWSMQITVLDGARNDTGALKELFLAIIRAAIWVTYFRVSKRVKATFIR